MNKEDKIVKQVIDNYNKRSKIGIKKYGTTLYENNTDNFLIHLQEELMDATLYIQKLLNQLNNKANEIYNIQPFDIENHALVVATEDIDGMSDEEIADYLNINYEEVNWDYRNDAITKKAEELINQWKQQ